METEKTIRQMRTEAGLTQAELAGNLEVDQATVARWESDEEGEESGSAISLKMFRRIEEICGQRQRFREANLFDRPTPYRDFDQQIAILHQYLDGHPSESGVEGNVPELASVKSRLCRLSARPQIALLGRFDAGKSHLVNHLLSQSVTRAQYRPTTAMPVTLHHLESRPEWLGENVVVVFRGEFEPGNLQHEALAREHLVAEGGIALLSEMTTYSSTFDVKDCEAVAYVDAPLLKLCSLIDGPGFNHQQRKVEDSLAINRALKRADAVLYLSPLVGCLDIQDLVHIPNILLRFGFRISPKEALERFTLVVTHAHNEIDNQDLEKALTSVSEELATHLASILDDSPEAPQVNSSDFVSSVFPFWSGNSERSQGLIDHLQSQLTDSFVQKRWQATEEFLQSVKVEASTQLNHRIAAFEKLIDDRKQAASYLEQLKAAEPQRKSKREEARRNVLNQIFRYNNDSVQAANAVYHLEMKTDHLEHLIKKNYDRSKDAQKKIGSLVIQRMQVKVSDELKIRGDELSNLVKDFLGQYSFEVLGTSSSSVQDFELPFDGARAFAAGLSGGVTFGLLALWASTAGNLGGYILIANTVGILSSLGIATGSSAAVMSGVAAIGGPITIGITIAVAIGLLVYSLFGESWQRRLAKRVKSEFENQGVKDKMVEWVQAVWEQTRTGFEAGANSVEKQYQEELKRQEEAIHSHSVTELKTTLQAYRDWRDFFGGMPSVGRPAYLTI